MYVVHQNLAAIRIPYTSTITYRCRISTRGRWCRDGSMVLGDCVTGGRAGILHWFPDRVNPGCVPRLVC